MTAGPIIIAGVDDETGAQMRKARPASAKALLSTGSGKKFVLFLKHRPRIEPGTEGLFDLQLSGHTHRGQIFPFRYASALSYPYNAGEQKAAAQVLGVREVVFLRLPDQGLEDTPAFRNMLVRQIRAYRPHTIVTSDPYRRYIWHRDHRIVGQVTLDAVFPFARHHLSYPDLLEEGLEPHKVRELLFFGSEDLNYRSDITATFGLKITALRCHESQMRELGVPDLEAWMREWSCSMAEGADCELAEAFHRIEITR